MPMVIQPEGERAVRTKVACDLGKCIVLPLRSLYNSEQQRNWLPSPKNMSIDAYFVTLT